MSGIYFNSKSKAPFCYLSNFYGGVESCYQQHTKIGGADAAALFRRFRECGTAEFIRLLMALQPQKKNWTERQKSYWMRDGRPIRGILSKLAAGASNNKRRLLAMKKLAPKLVMKPPKSEAEKRRVMLACLRTKYRKKPFRDILLSTGDRSLHEKPMRGKGEGNLWTKHEKSGAGKDLLGRLLMQVRKELRNEIQRDIIDLT